MKTESLLKSAFNAVLLACIIFITVRCQSSKSEEPRTPKAVFIIVDGISGDVIQKLNPPVLEKISKEGGFAHAYVGGGKGTYSETPTISAVGYNSLLTGTWVNKHNVWDNDIAAPNYHYWNLFRITEKHNPALKTAIFSTWKDNRTKLIGEGLDEAGKVELDFEFDGLEYDTINFPHDTASLYIQRIDEAVSDEAAKVIAAEGPDLSWVYLEFTDDMGHRFGDSPQFHNAIVAADKQIGKVWNAIKQREKKFNEDWLIVITTDHGRDAQTGHNHGGQSDRERSTWIVTNASDLNARFKERPGIVDIFPSICYHLKLPIPDEVHREVDGVPFIGPVDLADLKAEKIDGKISLQWKNLENNASRAAEIFVSKTNEYNVGGKDTYQKVGEVPVKAEKFEFDATGSDFLKILVKTPGQYLNVWLTDEKKKGKQP